MVVQAQKLLMLETDVPETANECIKVRFMFLRNQVENPDFVALCQAVRKMGRLVTMETSPFIAMLTCLTNAQCRTHCRLRWNLQPIQQYVPICIRE